MKGLTLTMQRDLCRTPQILHGLSENNGSNSSLTRAECFMVLSSPIYLDMVVVEMVEPL